MRIEKDYYQREDSVDREFKEDLDMHFYDKWKETGEKKYFQQLYRNLKPTLNKASQKAAYGSNIPQSVFQAEAAQQMLTAVENYNPKFGTKLSSHVYGRVQDKLKRVNYKYQNMARRVERNAGGVYQINYFNNEKLFLKDKLGREPSAQELSDVLGWSINQVEGMMNEDRKDLSLNQELEDLNTYDDDSAGKEMLAMFYYDMNPEEQVVYDYATGSHGKDAVLKANGLDADYKAIAQRLGMPESKVLKIRNKLARKVKTWAED